MYTCCTAVRRVYCVTHTYTHTEREIVWTGGREGGRDAQTQRHTTHIRILTHTHMQREKKMHAHTHTQMHAHMHTHKTHTHIQREREICKHTHIQVPNANTCTCMHLYLDSYICITRTPKSGYSHHMTVQSVKSLQT